MTIVIHSGDPRNIPKSEDNLLAQEIGLIDPTQEVRVSRYETKDFMPLADILTVWIPNNLAVWALGKTASAAADWVRRRIREGKERPGGRTVEVLSADGAVLRVIHVSDADSEPVDQTEEARQQGQRRPPPPDVLEG
jgi:hypothetical protein